MLNVKTSPSHYKLSHAKFYSCSTINANHQFMCHQGFIWISSAFVSMEKKSVTPCVEISMLATDWATEWDMLAANFETIPFEDAQTARLTFGGAVQG